MVVPYYIPPIPSRKLYINGNFIAPVKGKRMPIINPATELSIGDVPSATAEDVDLAVKAARYAFTRDNGKFWARAPGEYRAKFLRAISVKVSPDATQRAVTDERIARTCRQVKELRTDLARLEAMDCGKPIDEAEWDMDDVAGCFAYYARLAEGLDEKQLTRVKLPMDHFKSSVRKEPLGVVGIITPWNYPLLMATWKVAAALAAGCTAVLKPSELASMTCLELGIIAEEVGLPAGVLNIVTGLGTTVGASLVSHPGVDKIAFTGSNNTGKTIMKSAADTTKPVTLELGGKSPLIIFEDTGIDEGVEWAMFGAFWTNGQICSATSRLLIHESIAEEFLTKLGKWASSIIIANPLDRTCRLGPVVSANQHKKVLGYIKTAQSQGAKLVCGGKRPKNQEKGYFVEATVLRDVTPAMQIWKEEVFGPVLAVTTFKTEEEAIKLANDSEYGLAGAVLSKDEDRCRRVSEELQVGIVWINCTQPCFCEAPWGGTKRSGFGRDLGEWGLENYLTVKQITQYLSNDQWGWYPKPSRL